MKMLAHTLSLVLLTTAGSFAHAHHDNDYLAQPNSHLQGEGLFTHSFRKAAQLLGSAQMCFMCAEKPDEAAARGRPLPQPLLDPDGAGHPRFIAGVQSGGKMNIPTSVGEIFQAVDERLKTLDQLIKEGGLLRVHGVAFETRDLLFALPSKATALSEQQKKNLKTHLKKIRQQAALLDKYGDAKNANMTKAVFRKFQAEIRAIKSLIGMAVN
jgi:hypothetical protein